MSYQPGYPDPAAWQPPTAQQPTSPPLPTAQMPLPTVQMPPVYQPPAPPVGSVPPIENVAAQAGPGLGFGAPPAGPASGVATGGPAKGLRRLGLALMLAGVLGGLANYFLTRSAYVDSIKGLGFVVPGNATEIEFLEEGRYTLYYFWKGEFETEIDGDIETVTLDGPTSPVPVNAELLDDDDDTISIRRLDSDPPSYSGGGFEGIAFRRVQIDQPGDYTLTVSARDADDTDFGIAVGHEVLQKPTLVWPLLIALAGLGLGGLCVALSSRRPKPSAASPGGAGISLASSPPAPGAVTAWQPSPWPTDPNAAPAAAPPSVPANSPDGAAWSNPGGWAHESVPQQGVSPLPPIQPTSEPVVPTWSAPLPVAQPPVNPAAQDSTGWNPPPPN